MRSTLKERELGCRMLLWRLYWDLTFGSWEGFLTGEGVARPDSFWLSTLAKEGFVSSFFGFSSFES